MCGEHTLTADLPAAEHPGYAWGRALGRETLDTLLLEEALAAGARCSSRGPSKPSKAARVPGVANSAVRMPAQA